MTAQTQARVEAGGLLRNRMCGIVAQVARYPIQRRDQCISGEHDAPVGLLPADKLLIGLALRAADLYDDREGALNS